MTTIMPTTAASICLQGGWVVAIDNDADSTPPTPSSLSNCSWGGLVGGMGGMSTPLDDKGNEVGPTYEVVISCTCYVSAETEIKTRIVACGLSLVNAQDLGKWMCAPSHTIFNFSPRYSTSVAPQMLCTDVVTSAHPLDLDIHLQSFTIPCFPSLMIAMSRPAHHAVLECSS